jgi:hypothetical protein
MTVETRTMLGLEDIKSVEFECIKCHTKTVFPVQEFKAPPIRCSYCENSEQWIVPGSGEWEDLKRLGEILRHSSKLSQRFAMRLEIKPSASQKSELKP